MRAAEAAKIQAYRRLSLIWKKEEGVYHQSNQVNRALAIQCQPLEIPLKIKLYLEDEILEKKYFK